MIDNGAPRQRMARLYYKFKRVRKRLMPLQRYENLAVGSSLSLRLGLNLWRSYIERCFLYESQFDNEFLHVKYEDFVIEPAKFLESLSKFCGLPAAGDCLTPLLGLIRAERRFAFEVNKTTCPAFDEIKTDPIMQRLGYL